MLVTDKTREAMKIALFRALMEKGIENEQELWFVVSEMFGVKIPREVCVEGHQSFWELMCDDFFERVSNQACRASRGSGKTFVVGVSKSLKLICKPGIRISNFAATENQGNALFNYVTQNLGPSAHPEIKARVAEVFGSQAKSVPQLVPGRGSKPEQAVMKVLVGTLKGVNSSHVDDLVCDERAQMEDRIFQESLGMLTPKAPYKGVLTVISTVKAKGDPMDVLMEKSAEMGFKPYLNNILDVMTCQERDCSKCKESIATSDDGKEEKSFYDFCQGRLLGRSLGHYSVDATLRKFRGMGLTNAVAQLFCLEPEGEEKAFPMFRYQKHVVDRRSEFAGKRFFVFADFGKRDASVWLKAYLDNENSGGTIYIDGELHGSGHTVDDWIPILCNAGYSKAIQFLVDVAGRQTTFVSKKSAIEYLEDEGWDVNAQKVDELASTESLRDRLRGDPPGIQIHPDCTKLIEAFERATNMATGSGDNKVFLKVVRHNKFSHFIDAVRYGQELLCSDGMDAVESYTRRGR
jgi:hypothetical protein